MNDKTHKFLAIDDKIENLITLKALIKKSFPGSVILTAQSGKDGLKLAHEKEPDVILLDIMMPDMDGYEVCRIIKTDPVLQDIPVMFVTALNSDKETRIKAIETGAETFIHKPIDKLDLFIQLRTLLQLREYFVKKKEKINSLEGTLRVKDQEYARILSNLQDTYFRVDLSGNFTIVNHSAVKMYGCQSIDEILGQPAQILYANSKDREKLFEELKSKGFVEDFTCKGLRKDGTTFWVSMNVRIWKR